MTQRTTRRSGQWQLVGRYAMVVAVALFCVAPFFWLLITSLKTPENLYRRPPDLLPIPIYTQNFVEVFTGRPFALNIFNSVLVASLATVICIAVGALAAYPLGRLRFRGKGPILTLVLLVSMFPGIAIVAPLYLYFRELQLINTHTALVLPYVAFNLPLAIWLLTAFFQDLPRELEEAAAVDGATPLGAFWQVIVPLAAPGLFAATLLVFISAWNEFLFARTFLSRESAYTVTVAIQLFQGIGAYQEPWGQISAAAVIVTLPLVALVLVFQRRIVSGLVAGAVKG